MKKNKVTKSAFLNWYFSDQDDYSSAMNGLLDSLLNEGRFTITTQELFDSCGFIPQYICEVAGDEEYSPIEVELING